MAYLLSIWSWDICFRIMAKGFERLIAELIAQNFMMYWGALTRLWADSSRDIPYRIKKKVEYYALGFFVLWVSYSVGYYDLASWENTCYSTVHSRPIDSRLHYQVAPFLCILFPSSSLWYCRCWTYATRLRVLSKRYLSLRSIEISREFERMVVIVASRCCNELWRWF